MAKAARAEIARNTLGPHNEGGPAEHFVQYALYRSAQGPQVGLENDNEVKIVSAVRTWWPYVQLQCAFGVMHSEIKVKPMIIKLNDPETAVSARWNAVRATTDSIEVRLRCCAGLSRHLQTVPHLPRSSDKDTTPLRRYADIDDLQGVRHPVRRASPELLRGRDAHRLQSVYDRACQVRGSVGSSHSRDVGESGKGY